jgi:signal transduction histidine kinase
MRIRADTDTPRGHRTQDPGDWRERLWSSPVVGIGVSAMSSRPRTRFFVRVGELVIGVGFVLATLSPSHPKFVSGLVAALVCGAAWLAWIVLGDDRRRGLFALLVFSLAGGVCAATHTNAVGTHSTGLVFVGASAAATAFAYGLPAALLALVTSLGAFLVTNLISGPFPGPLELAVMVGLGAIIFGVAERQLIERGRETTLLATAQRRLALTDREAQLVNERNRLGRDLHDVLAHTLGAVSIQLTALDSRLEAGDSVDELRARLRRLHSLVGDGLLEARDAVNALRDDELSLESQITRLCTLHGAKLDVEGRSRPLPADQALAFYRVVQEALTNAAKHAPEGAVVVTLTYQQHATLVTVDNERGRGIPNALAQTGGGNGLDGMTTRVELAGGHCAAGPRAAGWRVRATIPSR